jgi:ribosomal protein S18 acetylase RimI-like enzyme
MGDIAFDAGGVPEHLPRVRHATPEDAGLLARFVQAGRREGTFREGPPADARSVLEYQRVAASNGREYHAYIIEEEERAIGYLDVQASRARGEILGLYLEPFCRGSRLGRHLFRWAVADLRARGCRIVSVEIGRLPPESCCRSERRRPSSDRPPPRICSLDTARP